MFSTHRNFDLSTGVKSASIAVTNSGNQITVLYHKTIVLEFKQGVKFNSIVLRNGGWDTVSTRHVINNALFKLGVPYHLARHKNKTYLMQTERAGEYKAPKKDSPLFQSPTKLKVAKQ